MPSIGAQESLSGRRLRHYLSAKEDLYFLRLNLFILSIKISVQLLHRSAFMIRRQVRIPLGHFVRRSPEALDGKTLPPHKRQGGIWSLRFPHLVWAPQAVHDDLQGQGESRKCPVSSLFQAGNDLKAAEPQSKPRTANAMFADEAPSYVLTHEEHACPSPRLGPRYRTLKHCVLGCLFDPALVRKAWGV
jgi:hypothetical protein